jgi:hypothetical protein
LAERRPKHPEIAECDRLRADLAVLSAAKLALGDFARPANPAAPQRKIMKLQ